MGTQQLIKICQMLTEAAVAFCLIDLNFALSHSLPLSPPLSLYFGCVTSFAIYLAFQLKFMQSVKDFVSSLFFHFHLSICHVNARSVLKCTHFQNNKKKSQLTC